MFTKIEAFFENHKFISSIMSFSLIIGIIKIISYFFNKAYYKYFNIDISFTQINIFQNMELLINNLIIIMILICEIYIIYKIVLFIYENKNNLKKYNSVIKILGIILITILLIIISFNILNTGINYYLSKHIKLDILSSIICTIFAAILAILKIKIFKKPKEKSREEIDKQLNNTYIIICIIGFFVVIINSVENLGEMHAKKLNTFLINLNSNKIILYNTETTSIVADYDYNEKDNSIVIYTNELEKIDNDNMKFSTKTFDEAKVEY